MPDLPTMQVNETILESIRCSAASQHKAMYIVTGRRRLATSSQVADFTGPEQP